METTLTEEILEEFINQGLAGIPDLIKTVINEAMKLERSRAIGAEPYERSAERVAQSNGYKGKTLALRCGKIELSIPQVRGLEFYPSCIKKGERSERALKLALAEMYISGVSTRKVARITETLCGFEVSATQVSEATTLLEAQLSDFQNKPLGTYLYVTLDARYEKVRQDHKIVKMAVLIAIGVNENGYREVLGSAVKNSEAEVNWKEFIASLKERGLTGVKMFTSDDHPGIKNALTAYYPNVAWQRCQFHLAQNAQAKAATKTQKPEIAKDIRSIFNQHSKQQAIAQAKNIALKWEKTNPKFSEWLENNYTDCLPAFDTPENLRSKIRTSNSLERVNREIKRRTLVVSIFPNPDSLLRLVLALLSEMNDSWLTASQPYMHFTEHSS